jgi:hypothetical protein
MNTLWLDKYIPKKLDDIIGHTDNIKKIKSWLSTFYDKTNSSSG